MLTMTTSVVYLMSLERKKEVPQTNDPICTASIGRLKKNWKKLEHFTLKRQKFRSHATSHPCGADPFSLAFFNRLKVSYLPACKTFGTPIAASEWGLLYKELLLWIGCRFPLLQSSHFVLIILNCKPAIMTI